jgi:hypothetical protein
MRSAFASAADCGHSISSAAMSGVTAAKVNNNVVIKVRM